jgi:hypothetical protein
MKRKRPKGMGLTPDWEDEVVRRAKAYERGELESVDGREAFARIDAKYARPTAAPGAARTDSAWVSEIDRRVREVEDGSAKLVDWKTARKEIGLRLCAPNDTIMTITKKLRAAGFSEQFAKGFAKGRAEERTYLLLRQLTLKFGTLSERAERRVRTASLREQWRFVERVLSAKTLAQVWGRAKTKR